MSEFGTGFAYNLGLFLCHAERKEIYKNKGYEACRWFGGASDHLIAFVIPNNFSHKELAEKLRDKCLEWRDYGSIATWEDVIWALQIAIDLLRAWDVQCGIESEKGDYE